MNTATTRLIISGSLFLFTLISGVWLSNSGKPLNGIIFTGHKLIALATVILIGVTVNYLRQGADIRTIELTAIVMTCLTFLALFVSGAVLSIGRPVPGFVLTIHQVALLAALVSSAISVYLLASGKSISQAGG